MRIRYVSQQAGISHRWRTPQSTSPTIVYRIQRCTPAEVDISAAMGRFASPFEVMEGADTSAERPRPSAVDAESGQGHSNFDMPRAKAGPEYVIDQGSRRRLLRPEFVTFNFRAGRQQTGLRHLSRAFVADVAGRKMSPLRVRK
jgi:hypothetical protein